MKDDNENRALEIAKNEEFGKVRIIYHDIQYLFAGSPVTFAELAEVAEKADGKKLDVKVVTRDDFEKAFTDDEISPLGKMPGTNYQDYALAGNNGEADLSPKVLEEVLGRSIAPLADALKELI